MSYSRPLKKCATCGVATSRKYCKPCHNQYVNSSVCVVQAVGWQCTNDHCKYLHDIQEYARCETPDCHELLFFDSSVMKVYRKCSQCYHAGEEKVKKYYTDDELFKMCVPKTLFLPTSSKPKENSSLPTIPEEKQVIRSIMKRENKKSTQSVKSAWVKKRPAKLNIPVPEVEEFEITEPRLSPLIPTVSSLPVSPLLEVKEEQEVKTDRLDYEDFSFEGQEMDIIARKQDKGKTIIYLEPSNGSETSKVTTFVMGPYVFKFML